MTTAQPPVHLCLLGAFQLRVAGRSTALPVQAQRLLALLATAHPRQPRTSLARALWRDAPEERAQANLRNAAWRVRLAGADVLRCSRGEIGLDPGLRVDLADAQRCAVFLLGGGSAPLDRSSIDVLDDDLLPDWDEEWLVVERERQRQLRLHALEALSARFTRAGRHAEAVAAGLAAVQAEPLRESAQRALVLAHLGEGNVSEAVRQVAGYRRILARELGIPPGEELLHLLRGAAQGAGQGRT
ncbi:AfsR/SARP family transcriptional regulator [Kineococcus indalonis]|uniref:AfsR/SARP family transcriptional regulator n=1 Tax=Kineococcus indalonis TaxID=2696566 RepID=UPI001412F980|nr:BTAD domain-containing putative transcriptional regulator [Kineococcus indalonis]NAZ87231.1 transcriptional regulator [Kineococcus indalonis]